MATNNGTKNNAQTTTICNNENNNNNNNNINNNNNNNAFIFILCNIRLYYVYISVRFDIFTLVLYGPVHSIDISTSPNCRLNLYIYGTQRSNVHTTGDS